MADVKISISENTLIDKLNKIYSKSNNTSSLMRGVAMDLKNAVEENFLTQGQKKWPTLKPETIEARRKINQWPGRMLFVTGRLFRSFLPISTENMASVTTNIPYAAAHHFGKKEDETVSSHSKTIKEKKVTIKPYKRTSNLSARPFAYLTQNQTEHIISKIEQATIEV